MTKSTLRSYTIQLFTFVFLCYCRLCE